MLAGMDIFSPASREQKRASTGSSTLNGTWMKSTSGIRAKVTE
jgi:hypothetical protein